jgi:hypothetical protein
VYPPLTSRPCAPERAGQINEIVAIANTTKKSLIVGTRSVIAPSPQFKVSPRTLLRICAVPVLFVREADGGNYRVNHAAGDLMNCKGKARRKVEIGALSYSHPHEKRREEQIT